MQEQEAFAALGLTRKAEEAAHCQRMHDRVLLSRYAEGPPGAIRV